VGGPSDVYAVYEDRDEAEQARHKLQYPREHPLGTDTQYSVTAVVYHAKGSA
jgi:hypothetical protein